MLGAGLLEQESQCYSLGGQLSKCLTCKEGRKERKKENEAPPEKRKTGSICVSSAMPRNGLCDVNHQFLHRVKRSIAHIARLAPHSDIIAQPNLYRFVYVAVSEYPSELISIETSEIHPLHVHDTPQYRHHHPTLPQ